MTDSVDIEAVLAEIASLVQHPAKLQEAEERLGSALATAPALQVMQVEELVRSVIVRSFLPKRQKRLLAQLDRTLAGTGSGVDRRQLSGKASDPRGRQDALAVFKTDVRLRLTDLADHHIFQWPHYEAFASSLLDRHSARALASGCNLREIAAVLREEVAAHTKEIFVRGYKYSTDVQGISPETALAKSTAGLARLLEVVASEYRRQLMRMRVADRAKDVRVLSSAMMGGILLGRCRLSFGRLVGASDLLQIWKLWVTYCPSLTRRDLERVLQELPPDTITQRLGRGLGPLAAALDEQLERPDPDQVCVIRSASYSARFDRLEITLVEPIQAAHKEVAFHLYLSEEGVDETELEGAVHRGMQLILAPLSESTARWVWRQDSSDIQHVVVDTSKSDAADRLRDNLSLAIASIGRGVFQDVPITYNFAKRFPLDRPDIGVDFRVPRLSVRRLLDKYQFDTGLRLWCSVRRSGKTTACMDLQAHGGAETVITETCQKVGTTSASLKDSFYRAVREAVDDGGAISATFVRDAIRRAADYDPGESKVVFVLDEYESLFEYLDNGARDDDGARLRVVQPILNQLLEFAEANLVIFLGLRPDAHYVLMEQNQLSPYVRPDQFPLFEFESHQPDCEFRELVRRVLTERIQCDDGFVGHLYAETGGHPGLTVNVLIAVGEWLIETRRPLSRLTLDATDFDEFGAEWLTPQAVALSDVYDVHRKFLQQGMSERARERMPWLYAVLHVLRFVAKQPGERMRCSLEEAGAYVRKLGLDSTAGVGIDGLLRTGGMANFFRVTGRTIRPRIRLYAKLAGAVVPATTV